MTVRYPSDSKPEEKADIERAITEARKHILQAHADRLTAELAEGKATGKWPAWTEEFKWPKEKRQVTRDDIEAGRAPRPRVLDMFAGGGSIPLEALRLGCEAYALDLNPVAHIIELCTLVYPQKYGKPDPNARGMTGPKNSNGETTWGGLANEVRHWGEWVLAKVKAEIGDLYPLIPDPDAPKEEIGAVPQEVMDFAKGAQRKFTVPKGYLTPVAYLWTRTVRCKNPSCGATVPLVRQTWLCKKKDRYVALKMIAAKGEKKVRFKVVEATTEKALGFDPAAGSEGGNATCPFCGTVADSDYVKSEACAKRMGQQMMAIVCTRPGKHGKIYLSTNDFLEFIPNDEAICRRTDELCTRTGLTVPTEPLVEKLTDQLPSYGISSFRDIFTSRQMLCLLTFATTVREMHSQLLSEKEADKALTTFLGLILDKIATRSNSLCPWDCKKLLTVQCFGRQALAMLWDFSECNPFGEASGGAREALEGVIRVLEGVSSLNSSVAVNHRGSATELPYSDAAIDVVITDPPYYDNIQYAALSDFFYIWLKRTVGNLYPEDFTSEISPKKQEAVASHWRYKNRLESRRAYEAMMAKAFREAHRVLKPHGQMIVVYAHKTTLGWTTLVESLRQSSFTVTEAWPLDTEGYRLIALDTAALASNIFLVARKRQDTATGSYEDEVRPELELIVRERVDTLWKMGITGADLVIAAVGAGLRAFTRFACVEYANGEEVPTEKFLAEVEGVVLETLLEKIFGLAGSGVAAVDGPSRFYVLWRYTYGAAEMDAGEAIVFTYGQNVELDGQNGLSAGSRALLEKKKGKYRLRDFTERGASEKLGMPRDDLPAARGTAQAGGASAPLIDVLQRILWLIENEPRNLNRFLDEARPDRERLRLVAQALAGAALEGRKGVEPLVATTASEQVALKKLVANWRTLIDQRLATHGMLRFDRRGSK